MSITRIVYSLIKLFWISSPLLFLGARVIGIYNFQYDVAVFGVLSLISFVTIYLTFDR